MGRRGYGVVQLYFAKASLTVGPRGGKGKGKKRVEFYGGGGAGVVGRKGSVGKRSRQSRRSGITNRR